MPSTSNLTPALSVAVSMATHKNTAQEISFPGLLNIVCRYTVVSLRWEIGKEQYLYFKKTTTKESTNADKSMP